MIDLSPRLDTIMKCVTGVETLADIGTDHGYLPVALVQKNKIARGIACDVNEKPLKKAEKMIKDHGYEKVIETRLGSGLSVLKSGEVQGIVIAGMGGLLIRELINCDIERAHELQLLIFQPMNNQAALRRYLEENRFMIIREELAKEESRIYEIIVAVPGKMTITNPLEYELGFRAIEDNHFLLRELINRKIDLENNIIENTKGKTTPIAKKQFTESVAYIQKLMEVEKCL